MKLLTRNVTIAFLVSVILPMSAFAQPQAASNRLERVLNLAAPDDVKRAASVSGTVVSDVTGQPIGGALVSLELTRVAGLLALLRDSVVGRIEPVLTDPAGRFEFLRVEEASYDLNVSMRQYHTAQRAQNSNGAPLLVRAGARLDQFLIRLLPAARIEGRVTDRAGIPLPGVRVELFEMNQLSSKWMDPFVSAANGSYYFDGLIPGRYVVQASSPETGQPTLAYARALTIPTEETRTLDFSLMASAGYSVSGQFVTVDSFRGRVDEWSLTATRMPSVSGRLSTLERMQTFDARVFTMQNLQPGLYRFTARAENTEGEAICGVVELVVSDSSLEAVQIPLSPCITVQAR